MTVRDTVADLLQRLRGMTQAGTADYTINTTAYWSDQQLQDVLDRNREYLNFAPMAALQTRIAGGSIEYKRFEATEKNLEKSFVIQDGVGSILAGSLYTENAMEGYVTFTADQAGSARYLTGYTYNMNKAAAEVWRVKASHYATQFDFSTDNHSVKRSQLAEQALKMAAFYENQGGISPVMMWRSDVLH